MIRQLSLLLAFYVCLDLSKDKVRRDVLLFLLNIDQLFCIEAHFIRSRDKECHNVFVDTRCPGQQPQVRFVWTGDEGILVVFAI